MRKSVPINLGKVQHNRKEADDIITIGKATSQNRVGLRQDKDKRLPGQTDKYFASLNKESRNTELINIRKLRGYSQTSLAQIAGLSLRTYQHYESGHRNINNVPADQLYKISLALDVQMEDLLSYTNEEKAILKADIRRRKEIYEHKTD